MGRRTLSSGLSTILPLPALLFYQRVTPGRSSIPIQPYKRVGVVFTMMRYERVNLDNFTPRSVYARKRKEFSPLCYTSTSLTEHATPNAN